MGRSWRSGQKPHQMEPWRMWFKPLSLTLKAVGNHYRAFNIRVSEAAHSHLHHRISTRHRFRFWAVLSPWKLLVHSVENLWSKLASSLPKREPSECSWLQGYKEAPHEGMSSLIFFLTSCLRLQFLTLIRRAFISFCFRVEGLHKLNSKSQGKIKENISSQTYHLHISSKTEYNSSIRERNSNTLLPSLSKTKQSKTKQNQICICHNYSGQGL